MEFATMPPRRGPVTARSAHRGLRWSAPDRGGLARPAGESGSRHRSLSTVVTSRRKRDQWLEEVADPREVRLGDPVERVSGPASSRPGHGLLHEVAAAELHVPLLTADKAMPGRDPRDHHDPASPAPARIIHDMNDACIMCCGGV